MKYVLSGAAVFGEKGFHERDILISDGIVADVSPALPSIDGATVFNFNNCYIFPGLLDVHVHLREPGFSFKETISSGTLAAARGGFTGVCSMPNLSPAPDCIEGLNAQLELIRAQALIDVHPYGTITRGELGEELSDFDGLFADVVGFSDDGKGVHNEELMREAMLCAKRLSKPIVAHCEDMALVNGGYINKCKYADEHGHRGICNESEWAPLKRDIELLKQTEAAYHVCHVSTKESVELIRSAKRDGVDITAETAPHYLLLDDSALCEDGRYKMNPPLRDASDREALIEGICDGTIDMIATDHAPHSAQEKSRGLEKSAFGITGLEIAFPLCYTGLVKTGIISLEGLIRLMHRAPRRRFGIGNKLKIGEPANLTVFDLDSKCTIDSSDFSSMGKSTPFDGTEVYGKCKMTIYNGRIVWQDMTEK